MVRPVVEYSSSVWDPYQAGAINSIEMIQRKAARFCQNRYKKTDSVTSMIQELNWNSLRSRREASRLSVFSRVYNNEECLSDLSSFIKRAPQLNLRHSHAFRLQSITCHKNVGHFSFLPRSIREWNALPQNILNDELIASPANLRTRLLNRQLSSHSNHRAVACCL